MHVSKTDLPFNLKKKEKKILYNKNSTYYIRTYKLHSIKERKHTQSIIKILEFIVILHETCIPKQVILIYKNADPIKNQFIC